jgi:demethylmenaquinone methyltransferase/2-methoxy-6-polyprenyl-1,4-benzoquinol methylase
MAKDDIFHRFADEPVTREERERRLIQVFNDLAPYYRRLCDLMTLGLHRIWRRVLVREANARDWQAALDVAGGTGEIARMLVRGERRVVVCDPSLAMLEQGRTSGRQGLQWVGCVAQALPFPDASVDLITVAFGLRNISRLEAALQEIRRVLKPRGRFLCLEVSQPMFLIRSLHRAFVKRVVPRIGRGIAPDSNAFDYLVDSILGFPDQLELQRLIRDAGFQDVHYRNLSLGVACLHEAAKPAHRHA